ncbi:cobaltochelatase CobT-related protein [Vibrio nomapromontoriensis]|uniref:cobaltochelatase CobT-related protein n=1 Tax=Vibrio nomapromontoriensis TaxID=2910246 RepID=UPI003D0F1CD0
MSNTTSQPITPLQKRLLDSSVAVARAISHDANLNYRGHRLYQGNHPCYFLAAHVNDLTFHSRHNHDVDHASTRGKIDSAAIRILFSDRELHRSLRPDSEIERLLFDFCEQVRVESIVPNHLQGVINSTRLNFHHWSQLYHQNGFTESKLGILLFTLMQVLYSRLHGLAVPEAIADSIEATRAGIAPAIGHALKALRESKTDQPNFAQHSLILCQLTSELVNAEMSNEEEDGGDTIEEDTKLLSQLALFVDGDIEDNPVATDITGVSRVFQEDHSQYQIYTAEFDKVIPAESMVRLALLQELRQQITDDASRLHINARRLAAFISNIVKVSEIKGIRDRLEEGIIDGKTLPSIVTSPQNTQVFYQAEFSTTNDCAISILMDCSGSMQQYAHQLSLIFDTLLKSLGLAGIPHEILGFTTGKWNGGQAYKQWLKQGQPAHPGRLNEVRHILFKDFNTPWRKARLAIAALRKADIYKEGIDGEAIQFASQRLKSRPEKRKILFVFSDGCPMDTATSTANDQFYLDNHLKHVIEIEQQSAEIEIYGVGMGIDLSTYYRKNLTIDVRESCIFSVCRHIFSALR